MLGIGNCRSVFLTPSRLPLTQDSPNPILHCSSSILHHSSVRGREIRGFRDDRLPCPCSPSTFMSMLYSLSPAKSCVVPYPRCPCSHPRHLAPVRIRASASLPEPNGAKVEYTPWLVAGLGNPGNKYHGTRHNVGQLAAYYQVPLRHILLVHDEMSLPNGVLRLKPKRGHGHHNGVKSVMEHLDGCHQFPRLCIGIGNPPGAMDMKAFLLQKFSETERKQVDEALKEGAEAVRMLVREGVGSRLSRFNIGQKYKYHKV
nr:chloroplastic group IIB intron splicing facilitator CRS2-B, chloroplastic [Ipomoea batatas]